MGLCSRARYQHAEFRHVFWILQRAAYLPFCCDRNNLKLPPFSDAKNEATCDWPWHTFTCSYRFGICLLVLYIDAWIYGMIHAEQFAAGASGHKPFNLMILLFPFAGRGLRF